QLAAGHDADGDNTIALYQFFDDHSAEGAADNNPAGDTSGYFFMNGQALADGTPIEVTSAALDTLQFQSRSGTDLLWARVYDGSRWSSWQSFHVATSPNHAPQVTASDYQAAHNASIPAATLFSVTDADNDVPTKYQLWDSTADASSGHFVVNGI